MSKTPILPELSRGKAEIRELFFKLTSLDDVAELLEIPRDVLVYILYRATYRMDYRTFEVAKRGGGVRQIAAPHPTIKLLQSKLNMVLQTAYAGKPSVHGFVPGTSIVTNARRHVGKQFVLNVDLKDFFPSINFGRVWGMLKSKPYKLDQGAATVLAQICCFDRELPQGAPTSPIISNMICGKLDSQLQRLAHRQKCIYTRYADDLTLSTRLRQFPKELAERRGAGWSGEDIVLGRHLVSVIHDNGFTVNEKKLRLQHRTEHQEVTGITVNEIPNVGRRYVRQIRAMLHAWEKFGSDDAEEVYREKYDKPSRNPGGQRPSFPRVVRGKIAFLRMIKGEADPVYRGLARKLHEIDPSAIAEVPEEAPLDTDVLVATPETSPAEGAAWQHWFRQYKDMIYHLEVLKDGVVSSGSVFAWMNGLATAVHNLTGVVKVSPPFPDGKEVPPEDCVFHERHAQGVDVAIIQLSGTALGTETHFPIRLDPLQEGEAVAALGFPTVPQRQPALSIIAGHVESVTTDYAGKIQLIQVSARLAGGMSGGPVIDGHGNLVGIVIESVFAEKKKQGSDTVVPQREFETVLPVKYLLEMAPSGSD